MALVVGACASGGGDAGDGRVRVVASFYPLAEIATRVGGEAVDVQNLTRAGVEPHDVELSPDQVDDLEDADLVLYLGAGFQPAVEEVVDRREGPSLDVLATVDAVDAVVDEDVHFWLDPQQYADAVAAVVAAMSEAVPEREEEFERTGEAFADEVLAFDADAERRLATCARREIVVAHAAFGYLAARYDLEQEAIAGLSPESEPDPDRLATLTDLIESRGVTTVFYERLVPPDVAETIARETGAATAVLDPIEGLTAEQQAAGDTYLTVMRANVDALAKALDCR